MIRHVIFYLVALALLVQTPLLATNGEEESNGVQIEPEAEEPDNEEPINFYKLVKWLHAWEDWMDDTFGGCPLEPVVPYH